jgi:hypothetical protein
MRVFNKEPVREEEVLSNPSNVFGKDGIPWSSPPSVKSPAPTRAPNLQL